MRILHLNILRKIISGLIIPLSILFAQSSAAVNSNEPFENTVETTLFDIYLGDKLKGAVLADYTKDWILISDPKDVVDQLKDLKNGTALLPLLEGQIEKRRELPDIGSIHFDINTFSIVINVTPKFLGTTNLNLLKRVGDPEDAASLQQRVSVVASGSTQAESNSALSHRGIASYGSYYAIADGAIVSDREYELTQATAGGITGDYRTTGGLLQTQGNSFSPSLQYSGLKVETAEELFLDQDLVRGSKFEVFVPSRSRVEFYRDGRLIAVQVLEFGLREVDTTNFPQGSYDVDIVLIDSFGNTTRQRKFFTKAGFLASRAQPIYSLQGGVIRDNLDSSGTPVYQGGVRWRASDIFDLNTAIYGSDNMNIGTIETLGLYRDVRFGLGYNQSTESDSGITSSLGSTIWSFNMSAAYTETLDGGIVPEVRPPSEVKPFDPVFDLPNRTTDLLFQDRYSNSYSVSRRLGQFNFRYADEKSSGDGTPSRFSKGAYMEWAPIEGGIHTLRFLNSLLDTDRGEIFSSGFVYGYRITDEFVFATQFAYQDKDEGDESVFLTTFGYDEKDQNEVGLRTLLTSEARSKKIPEQGKTESFNNQLDIDQTGDLAQTVGFVRDSRTDDAGSTGYGVSATSSFLISSDGEASLSHPVSREAVFIGEVESKTTNSTFEVLLDDQAAGTVVAGGRAVIGVTPYRTYNVKLRPMENSDLVTYDSASSTVTIFPGNVVKRKWQVEKVFILLGRIVDEFGEPVARQRIKGTQEYTATEDDGTFQAEIGGYETLTIDSKTNHCTLRFDIPSNPEYFLDIGDIICVPGGGVQSP